MSFISSRTVKVTREDLASDTGQGILTLAANDAKLMELHKSFLQSNLTLTAYVSESRKTIASLKNTIILEKRNPSEVAKIIQ